MKTVAQSALALASLLSILGCSSQKKPFKKDTIEFVQATIGRPLPDDAVVVRRSTESEVREGTFWVLHAKGRLLSADEHTAEVPVGNVHATLVDFVGKDRNSGDTQLIIDRMWRSC